MRTDDYQAPTTFATEHAPRERASQDTAAQHRARPTALLPTTTPRRPIPPRIIIAGGMLLLLAALALAWPSRPLQTQSAPEPTRARALAAPTPVLVSTPTIAPTAAPAPTQPATAHVDSVPPTGRGLTIEAPVEIAKPIVTSAPVEIPVIATQAAGAIARPGLGQCLHGQTFTDQGCKNLDRAHEKIVGTP